MRSQVNIVAHRGASGTHPENTLSAFREAIRLGVESIEFDVHLSKDDELVIIHDSGVDRTTDGSGEVEDLTLEEIKKFDAGVRLSSRFFGERIPTLSETLDTIPRDIRLNIHVKTYTGDRGTLITGKVVDEIARRDILDSAFFTSDAEAVRMAKTVNPDVTICNLSGQGGNDYVEFSKSLGSQIIQPSRGITTKDLVEKAHANKMAVNVFYADEEEDMLELMEMGVDGILTNFPERLKNLRDQL